MMSYVRSLMPYKDASTGSPGFKVIHRRQECKHVNGCRESRHWHFFKRVEEEFNVQSVHQMSRRRN